MIKRKLLKKRLKILQGEKGAGNIKNTRIDNEIKKINNTIKNVKFDV